MDKLPAGSCDCHAHVFGPYHEFPLVEGRSYTPPEAPLAALESMMERVGLSRVVLIHPSAYGLDHSAMLNAIAASRYELRGVAAVGSDVADDTLERLNEGGVRAVRFTEALGVDGKPFAGAIGLDHYQAMASRLKSLGWHVHVWGPCSRVVNWLTKTEIDMPFVLDHVASLSVAEGLEGESFQTLLALLREGRIWVKLCPQRSSSCFPGYEDVRPFHEAMLEANSDNLLWASDHPFIRMGERTPSVEQLLGVFFDWTQDENVRRKILVDNPARLFGFRGAN